MSPNQISVTVLTKNSQKYLKEVLSSLTQFDEVVLYDTGSKDDTMSIAREFKNVKIFEAPFEGFGPTHNKATNVCTNDWVLSIDSDEVVSPEMAQEILNTNLKNNCVYSFPRNNYFNGKWIKWCGWYPDKQYRLYNRKCTKFTDAQVHESIIVDGQDVVDMKNPIIHYSYASISDFLVKMQFYSELFANQNVGKKSSSLGKALLHSYFTFFKNYILKRGFLGGYEGFVISKYNADTAYYKYLKLYEKNCEKK